MSLLPAGVTLGQYIRFSTAAFLSMLIGSEIVHEYFRPLNDIDNFISEEIQKLPPEQQVKLKDLRTKS